MLERIAVIVVVLTALSWSGAARAAEVDVLTRSGLVAGLADGGVEAFRGIPFAAPPVGPLRWRPPAAPAAWAAKRDASADGPACPQVVYPDGRYNGGGYAGPTSEDCLNLNIWAPAGARHAPVMVWIFGGGNTAGANSIAPNDGRFFARDGVVLVTVNYRLGALGWFAHPALTKEAPRDQPLANYGLMDQIAAFNGSSTTSRRSAATRRTSPSSANPPEDRTCWRSWPRPPRAACSRRRRWRSGPGWALPVSLAKAERDGVDLAQSLGLPAEATAEQLRALPVDKLVAARGRYGPVVEGRLMHESTTEAFARGDEAPVPLIIGSNSWEASLLPPTAYASYLAAASPELKVAYAGAAGDDSKLAQAMFTDATMGAPSHWIAAHQSAKAPAWLYYFSYVRVVRRGKIPGANHTSENPYVFDTQMIVPNYSSEIVQEDRDHAALMHSCWVAFATTGAQTCKGAPAWPSYTPAQDHIMEFGLNPEVRAHFRKHELDAQEAAQAKLLHP